MKSSNGAWTLFDADGRRFGIVLTPGPVTDPLPVFDTGVMALKTEPLRCSGGIGSGGLLRSTDGCLELPLSLLAALVYRSTLLSLLGGLV